MKIFTVTNKRDLLTHRPGIDALFYSSFGQRELGEIWDWAYINNPNGEPIVSLCYQYDQLVGHYAIVPMPLSNGGECKNSYLAMTTMVAGSHRKFGLFPLLARATYEAATAAGIDFVFGFPNSQAMPGLRKRLNWTLPETDYLATLDKTTLMKAVSAGIFEKTGRFSLNLADTAIRTWRLSRPGSSYEFENGLAYKRYEGAVDLLWWESPEALVSLPDDTSINVLVLPTSGLKSNRRFDYQFGGMGLRSAFDAAVINREMAISDLF